MSRWLLSCYGALVQGATFGVVLGALAAMTFSKMPGGAREGGGAMAGIFFVGPLAGFVGLVLGGWVVWKLLADAERAGAVAIGLTVQLLVLVAGTVFALQPKTAVWDDYPGRKAEFEVEVSFPAAQIEGLGKTDQIEFQMRSADGTETAPWKRDAIRKDGDRSVVPGVFSIRTTPRSKLLAVMKNEAQVMCSTLNVEEAELGQTTEWSEWQEMDAGLLARWRLVVR